MAPAPISGIKQAFVSCEMDGLTEKGVAMTRSKTYMFGGTVTVLTVLVTASILHASHPRFSWNIIDTGHAQTTNLNTSEIDVVSRLSD